MKTIIIVLVLLNIRTCPSTDFTEPGCGGCTPPCYEEGIAGNLTSADSVKTVLNSLVDGGNTQALVDMIQTENQRGKVKDTLLAISPYLSDRVMIELITKNKPYPDGIIKEVILANSPVTDTVLNTLLNRQPPLAPGIIKEILDAQQGISARALLENQVSFFLSEAALSKNNLISYFLHNDTLGTGIDSIIPILEQDTLIDAKEVLVSAYLATGDTANAQLLIDSLALISETQNFAAIQKIIINILEDSATFDTLLVDTVLRQTVENIANDTLKFGYLTARAILTAVFDTSFPEFIDPLIIQQFKKGYTQGDEITDTVAISATEKENEESMEDHIPYRLTNYPNPYRDGTVIAAYIPHQFENGYVIINNLPGSLLRKYKVKPGHNYIEISDEELGYGIYFYSLHIDGRRIETKKMIHLR